MNSNLPSLSPAAIAISNSNNHRTTKRLHGDHIDRRQLVLVIGATAGPGLALAYQHASLGNDLVLVGRRKKALDDLAAQLRHQHPSRPIDVSTHAANLSSGPSAAEALHRSIVGERNQSVDVVICNADFCRYDTTTSRRILEDDTTALGPTLDTVLTLTSLFADDMAKRGGGGTILNIGSAGSILDDPTNAVAIDEYIAKFSRNVSQDLRSRGVRARIQNHILRREREGGGNMALLRRSLSKLFGIETRGKREAATKGNLRIRPSTRCAVVNGRRG
mmetsp:Transcript_23299/g.67223  ORF Transcript_23299/g.67223 Transcript_23299/m.67223 type:complete len:276 (-) Transcript_23299:63-890(-)